MRYKIFKKLLVLDLTHLLPRYAKTGVIEPWWSPTLSRGILELRNIEEADC